MSNAGIFGLSAAMVTPFLPEGGIDVARCLEHARRCIAGGCDGVTLFGTTGEGYGIGLNERGPVLAALAKDLPQGVPLTVGVAACPPQDAAAQGRQALEAGARNLLVAPPFYLKGPGEDGLYDWFAQALDAMGPDLRGVILYNIPGQTAVAIPPALVGRLRASFGAAIAGVKDSSGDRASTLAYLADHADIAILVGDERHLPEMMAKGAQGSICGFGNIGPDLVRRVIHDGDAGQRMMRIVDLICTFPVMPAVKALVAHLSGDAGFESVRPPLRPLTAGQKQALIDGYERLMSEG